MRTKFKDTCAEPQIKNNQNLLYDTKIEGVFDKKYADIDNFTKDLKINSKFNKINNNFDKTVPQFIFTKEENNK